MEYMQTGARKTCDEVVAALSAPRETATLARWVDS
jgi:hypothetical protein